jgi:hypothetical protein
VANLKEDLAALKIDHSERAGGRSMLPVVVLIVVAVLALGGYYLTTRLQTTTVKVATATAVASGSAGAGAVLDASGYVIARRRATVS